MYVVHEKLSKLIVIEKTKKEEREHLMQETLKSALKDEKEVSIWKTKAEVQVETKEIKVGNVVEREKDLIFLQEKYKFLK